MLLAKQYMFNKGLLGLTALNIANAKVALDPVQAFFLGVMCNALVCMAVWLCYSARTTTDKILSIIFPISMFVAAGFEHSVANMYFVPMGLLIKQFAPQTFWLADALAKADPVITIDTFSKLTWGLVRLPATQEGGGEERTTGHEVRSYTQGWIVGAAVNEYETNKRIAPPDHDSFIRFGAAAPFVDGCGALTRLQSRPQSTAAPRHSRPRRAAARPAIHATGRA